MKKWKKVLAEICTVLIFVTMPGINVLADEMQEEESIAFDSEGTEQDAEDSEKLEEIVPADEDMVGNGAITVGDGVTATFDANTGAVEFYSDGGMLWSEWLDKSGLDMASIESIKVSSGTVYLPTDSREIFSLCHYDWYTNSYSSNLREIDLSNFDTSKVRFMQNMFRGCSSLTSLDLSSFNTSNVEYIKGMFYGCSSLTSLDLSSFDTSNVGDMSSLFEGCSSLTSLDLSSFNTSNVKGLDYMFSGCSSLTSLDLSSFNTSKAEYMDNMFRGCSSLTSLNLSGFDTSKVVYMDDMFRDCSNLISLDLSSFDMTIMWSMDNMYEGCSALQILKTPKKSETGVALPFIMYDDAGNEYKELFILSKSLTLSRNKPVPTPTPMPKATVSGFSDVQDTGHAYYDAIYWAAGAGITKGYSDGTFGINKPCTRGEMMMFLWRYAGKPAPKNVSKSPFKDVKMNHTFYKAILWGSQKGITKGYSDGTFGINKNVSRGECMMFLWRLKGKPAPKAVAKSPFTDVPKNHVFYNAILWGAQHKITTGYTSGENKGKFMINDNCSRGQIMTFLYRAF